MWFPSSSAIVSSRGSHLWKLLLLGGLSVLSGLFLVTEQMWLQTQQLQSWLSVYKAPKHEMQGSLSLRNVNAETHMVITSSSCWKLPGWSLPTAQQHFLQAKVSASIGAWEFCGAFLCQGLVMDIGGAAGWGICGHCSYRNSGKGGEQ